MEGKSTKLVTVKFIRFQNELGGVKYFRQFYDSELRIDRFDKNLPYRERDDDVESTDSEIDYATSIIKEELKKAIKKIK